ncbi:hypothetical protein GCM10011511_53930 [Puia dinghuensis]|uniref:Uncharacterized protein n=2 Tax=Puia dinghuensis TaxID=1792502 RepID=A0A8J2UIR6_9BACT|nr:hypothetical protein GCM10011511_53930 [Puia dinghuensis]
MFHSYSAAGGPGLLLALAVILALVLSLLLPMVVPAQDYFADRNSTGTPILFGKDTHTALFACSGSIGDNSIKANFFKQYWLNAATYKPERLPRGKNYLGWGLSGKAGTVNGLGTLFSYGDFSPTFTSGAYLAYSRKTWKPSGDGTVYGNWALILSSTYTTCYYNIYYPRATFRRQLVDTFFNGFGVSLSFVDCIYKGNDDIYAGASVSVRRQSNYPFLTKVTIHNDTAYTTSGSNGSSGTTRTVTYINSNGDTYGVGPYVQYTDVSIRFNFTWVPAVLEHNLAFIVYPSIDLSQPYTPVYNAGASIALLKTGSPSTPLAALFFELDDVGNAYGSTYTFAKRSFRAGISTTLNILTGSMK